LIVLIFESIVFIAATCFGGINLTSTEGGSISNYTAMWRSRGNRVEFELTGSGQGWVGIGFSHNRLMVTILISFILNIKFCNLLDKL